jgi:hypothetical protein
MNGIEDKKMKTFNFTIKSFVIMILLIMEVIHSQGQSSFPEIIPNDGSIHSLGNGKMCIYEKGPDIITAYTGPYSSPSFLKMEWLKDEQADSRSIREPGTAIWTHSLKSGTIERAELLDFVDSETSCFVRKVQTKIRITFRIKLEKYVQLIDNSKQLKSNQPINGLLMIVPPGTTFYQTYVYPRILYSQFLTFGKATIQSVPGSGIIDVVCEPGESYLYLFGGPEYPEMINNTRKILAGSPGLLLSKTRQYWTDFTKRRKDFTHILPAATPDRDKLLKTIDDVAVLLKTQQSIQGAVLAGYPYPLGYVRDQYGVSRGLLALGLNDEARSIFNFYWQIWKKYGYIHNAQGIGVDGIFHIHENDDVEITGYLILQALDLLNATHDEAFMLEISPMLDWAFRSPKKWLVKDMLPFNGDETYVAGGLLPRSALNDGSAEATMLYLESGQKYLDWISSKKLWTKEIVAENQALLLRVKLNFRNNFWHNDILWTNNPERAKAAELPRFRHGVCESSGPNCLMNKYQGIAWTERNENDRYVCAGCISGQLLPRAEAKEYNLPSVALAPFYMRFSTIPYDQLKNAVLEILMRQEKETRLVGYDYGFLLTALTKLDLPESLSAYQRTLSVVDQEGSWSEYYLNDQPSGTRCRPWESAINLEALIGYAMKEKQK